MLQRSCVSGCHTQANPSPGNLVLDDLATYDGLPGDYKRLADDQDADWGHPPVITFGPVGARPTPAATCANSKAGAAC